VIIIGAGPAGLAAANGLANRNVECRILEKGSSVADALHRVDIRQLRKLEGDGPRIPAIAVTGMQGRLRSQKRSTLVMNFIFRSRLN
jgi:2-polyprenyl-6-methoxyphenol hydroxylase-like FAD-dependent oxidoreductase